MLTASAFSKTPNPIARHYSQFRVDQRLLLTGHSHQAWPDCGFDGQKQAWLDAAEHVDNKWEAAFSKAQEVRRGFARLLNDKDGHIALSPNTHELVVRLLSALALAKRPRIVTTDGEFHTIRRQLDRLAEENIEVVKVSALPANTLSERLIQALDSPTAVVMVSCVLFKNAHIVPDLGEVMSACLANNTSLLVDAYHAINVVPFSIKDLNLQQAFIIGGGYKYCQLGEGNCFMRFPADCDLRPVITGWFSEFSALTESKTGVSYGQGPDRFAGATYDPTSHYRAAEVFNFFKEQSLDPHLLRAVNQHQIELLAKRFDQMDLDKNLLRCDRSVDLQGIGGFLALESPEAETICHQLRIQGVSTDFRGQTLRLGPAPYLSDAQLNETMDILHRVIRGLT